MTGSRFRVTLYTIAAISLVAILGSEPEIYLCPSAFRTSYILHLIG
jgi:hypothetical protein